MPRLRSTLPRANKIRLIFLALALLAVSCSAFNPNGRSSQGSGSIANFRATPTPFLPIARSLTPTHSPSATSTFTDTPTATSTATQTPFPPTATPELTQTETGSAWIEGFIGHAQWYLLDCETRSAVDWAAFFGFNIDYAGFLDALPKSDDPEEGFVGDYWDAQGNIPPAGYGVHAAPIAGLLRSYGVPVIAIKGMSLEQLQQEITAGRPVIVWVIYLVQEGTPISYTASSGNTTIVAHYEHTVTVIGYDSTRVLVMDGNYSYFRTIDQFLNSWAVLGNMAVVYGSE